MRDILCRSLWPGALVLALCAAPVAAQTLAAPDQHRQCLACHQVDKKRVGPSFAAIAQRYADSPGATQYLADVIRQGSRQKWGAVPMPAQTGVDPADARALAAWILSLADAAETGKP